MNQSRTSFRRLFGVLAVVSLSGHAGAVGTDDFYGVMFSYGENVTTAASKLDDLGVRWCRLWIDISNWDSPAANSGNAMQQANDLHALGFKTIMETNSLNGAVPSYAQAKAVFEWVAAQPGLLMSVDVWEILNEVNNTQYFSEAHSTAISFGDQAAHYVTGPLRAAWDVFHVAHGGKVLGCSFTLWQQSSSLGAASSYTLALTQAYVDGGYLSYCDFAGLHPYHETAAGQIFWVKQARTLYAGKPIIISEWGLKPSGYTVTTYTDAMSNARDSIYGLVRTACYYRFSPGNGWFGLVGSVSSGYAPVEPPYTTYKSWPRSALAAIGKAPDAAHRLTGEPSSGSGEIFTLSGSRYVNQSASLRVRPACGVFVNRGRNGAGLFGVSAQVVNELRRSDPR